MTTKRTFTTAEELLILKEASEHGVKPALEMHAIFTATYYSRRKKFNEMGDEGLKHGMTPAHLKRIEH